VRLEALEGVTKKAAPPTFTNMAWYTNPATLYLAFYNAACIVGWGYIYTIFYGHYEATGHLYGASLWAVLEMPLKVVQTAAVMEVVHASVGLVKSNPFLTGVQGGWW
jgi:hypothetical protein